MPINLGSAFGKVELDASGVKSGAAAAAAAMAGVSRAGREMGASFDLIARDAKAFGNNLQPVGQALVGMSAGLVLVGGASVKSAGQFEQSMNLFQASSQATSEQMARAGELAKALGADMSLPATSAIGAGNALTELAKAGLSVEDALTAAKGTLQLSIAGNLSEAESAMIAANSLNAFGLKGSEATRVANLLAATSTSSGSSIRELAMATQMAGSVFAAAGIPIEDMAAAIGEMSRAGIKGSDAGTSLKTMLMRLQAPTGAAASTMRELGINVYDSSGQMLPFREIIGSVEQATARLTEQQRAEALTTIFGADAIRGANIVLAGGVKAFDSMKEAVTREGAAADLSAARMKGLTGATENLKSQTETAGLAIGQALSPAIEGLINQVAGIVAAFNNASPAMKGMASGALALTAAVTGVAGGFILLAPKIIESYGAMVQFAAFGKDVVAGLQLMKAGMGATQVATTGLAGATAAALVPLVAVTVALIAAYKAYEFYQENQKRATEAGGAFATHLKEMEKAGKSTEQIMAEYAATQERVNATVAAAPGYLRPFIDQQKILAGGVEEYARILAQSNLDQEKYETELQRIATAQKAVINSSGDLVREIKEYDGESNTWIKTGEQMVQTHYMLSAAERNAASGASEVTDEYRRLQDAQDGLAAAARAATVQREKSTVVSKEEAKAAEDLRDKVAQWHDAVLAGASAFAASNAKLKERTDLEQELDTLERQIAKNGPAQVATITKTTMTTNELTAAQSKLYAAEEGLWNIKRKKGETDAQLNARMDQQRVTVDNLKNKIAEATGVVGAHTGVVGGATAAQDKEREAILAKMTAIDAEIQKELARQAVDSLTPEMFGTGADAAAKYAEAKRGLMLATGMVTTQSLAEKDAIGLLTTALATGKITPEQYALALGNVKSAAADGKVSLGELTDKITSMSGTKFSLKNMDVRGAVAETKPNAVAAGQDLAAGLAQGIQAGSAGMGTAITASVDLGLDSLRTAYQMKSPSLVMAGVGNDLMAGMALGLSGGATALGAAMTDSLNMAMLPMMQGALMITGAMAALNGSVAMTRDTITLGLNAAMLGTVELAGGAVANIGTPIQAGMTLAYNAFSGAAQMANALADVMREIKGMSGITSHITLVTHQKTIIEKTEDKNQEPSGPSGGGPMPTSGAYALGGVVARTGMALVHRGEPIFTPGMVRGMEAIPLELMGAARGIAAQVAGGNNNEFGKERIGDRIRNDYGSTNGGRSAAPVTINQTNYVRDDMDIHLLAYQVAEEIKRMRGG